MPENSTKHEERIYDGKQRNESPIDLSQNLLRKLDQQSNPVLEGLKEAIYKRFGKSTKEGGDYNRFKFNQEIEIYGKDGEKGKIEQIRTQLDLLTKCYDAACENPPNWSGIQTNLQTLKEQIKKDQQKDRLKAGVISFLCATPLAVAGGVLAAQSAAQTAQANAAAQYIPNPTPSPSSVTGQLQTQIPNPVRDQHFQQAAQLSTTSDILIISAVAVILIVAAVYYINTANTRKDEQITDAMDKFLKDNGQELEVTKTSQENEGESESTSEHL